MQEVIATVREKMRLDIEGQIQPADMPYPHGAASDELPAGASKTEYQNVYICFITR